MLYVFDRLQDQRRRRPSSIHVTTPRTNSMRTLPLLSLPSIAHRAMAKPTSPPPVYSSPARRSSDSFGLADPFPSPSENDCRRHSSSQQRNLEDPTASVQLLPFSDSGLSRNQGPLFPGRHEDTRTLQLQNQSPGRGYLAATRATTHILHEQPSSDLPSPSTPEKVNTKKLTLPAMAFTTQSHSLNKRDDGYGSGRRQGSLISIISALKESPERQSTRSPSASIHTLDQQNNSPPSVASPSRVSFASRASKSLRFTSASGVSSVVLPSPTSAWSTFEQAEHPLPECFGLDDPFAMIPPRRLSNVSDCDFCAVPHPEERCRSSFEGARNSQERLIPPASPQKTYRSKRRVHTGGRFMPLNSTEGRRNKITRDGPKNEEGGGIMGRMGSMEDNARLADVLLTQMEEPGLGRL
jgi:hypothetical protein